MKIWITRDIGGSVTGGGLDRIKVWFVEPCIQVRIPSEQTSPFDEDIVYDEMRKLLQGIVFQDNGISNFIYRSENKKDSDFGNKLIRNPDGIDFPKILEELYKENKIGFEHTPFNCGRETNFNPIKASILFGFSDDKYPKAPDVSEEIWRIVCEEFNNRPIIEWSEIEKYKPWYKFCKQLDINITLK